MIQRFADWLVYDIFGLDASTALGEAINFFFYDTIKILILLFFISVIMGIINAYFPIERLLQLFDFSQTIWIAIFFCRLIWCYYPVLFLFFHTAVYWICERGHSFGSNICLSDNLAFGE